MKLNYRLIAISCFLMGATLGFSTLFTFVLVETKLLDFLNNISLNIFAGAIVLLATSLIEYFSNRRKNLEKLMLYIIEYRNAFSKIDYLDRAKVLGYEEYKKKFKKKDTTTEEMLKLSAECDEYNKSLMKNLDKIIDTYIRISELNLDDFWALYSDLRFIIKNKSTTLNLYNYIFKYIYNNIDKIKELAYHLKIYRDEGSNPIIIYEKIRECQKNVFYEKEIKKDEKLDEENMSLIENGLPYQLIYTKKGSRFIYNKLCKHLNEQFKKVSNIAYFNRKNKNYFEE